VPTFADGGCRVVTTTVPHYHILGSRYFFFQVAPQLYSRGWVDPVPDPLPLRKSFSAGNRTQTSGSVARNCYHYTTEAVSLPVQFEMQFSSACRKTVQMLWLSSLLHPILEFVSRCLSPTMQQCHRTKRFCPLGHHHVRRTLGNCCSFRVQRFVCSCLQRFRVNSVCYKMPLVQPPYVHHIFRKNVLEVSPHHIALHVTTDGQSASLSWCQSLFWGPWPNIFFFSLTIAWLLKWGALSEDRTVLQFPMQSLTVPNPAGPITIFYCLIWDSPKLEGQVPVFISPRNSCVCYDSSWSHRKHRSQYFQYCKRDFCGDYITTADV
jgi:hypothetical protein